MHYIIQYDVAAIFLSLAVLVGFFRKKVLSTTLMSVFKIMAGIIIVSCEMDILSVCFIENPEAIPLWLNYIINILYHSPYQLMAITFFYCISVAANKSYLTNKKALILISLPALFVQLLIFTSPFTKLYFYFDSNLVYSHGVLFYTGYIISLLYILAGITITFCSKKDFTFYQIGTVYLFSILDFTAILIQFYFPEYLIVGFVTSIGFLLIFLSLEDPANYLDGNLHVYNRRAFELQVKQDIALRKKQRFVGLQIKDLTYMNENIGRNNTEKFLQCFIKKLSGTGVKNLLFRISGSRFALILPSDSGKQKKVLENIKSVLNNPFEVDGFSVTPTMAITVFGFPEDVANLEDVIAILENTLMEMPESSYGIMVPANPIILEKKRRKYEILQYLKESISKDNFDVVFQPIYSLEKQRFTSAEALLRLKGPETNFYQTEEFVKIAEKYGLINEIGELAFNKVFSFMRDSKIIDYGIHQIGINLSVIQCMQPNLWQKILDMLSAYELGPENIVIELKENSVLVAGENLRKNMTILHNQGVEFFMDGFGTETSNTMNLVDFEFQSIKLNKQMLENAQKDAKALSVLKFTIKMIKALHMVVLAEGVETKEEVQLLQKLGCDFVQGYYYSRPVTADELKEIAYRQKK